MIFKRLVLSITFLSMFIPVFAQKTGININGKIVDSQNEPLPGAVVMIQGTAKGTMADEDGSFTITAKKTDVLEVSILGFVTTYVEVAGKTNHTIVLKEDAMLIEEAIVEVGYGEQRLVDLTGTVSRVEMDDMLKAPVLSFDQALQGRVAGLSITSSDGQPGAEMDIVIRGANSLTQSNSPLYVVDGFPLEDFSASALSQNDIASITVLKDASATAIYGSRGANGVIIIETKRGKTGKPTIQYNGNFAMHQASKRMEMMNPYEFVVYQIERSGSNVDKYLTNADRTLEDYLDYKAIDWQDLLFRNAFVHTHDISMMGGDKKTRYSVSGSVVDQEGVIHNSGYQKYSGRIAYEQQITGGLKFSVNASYLEAITNGQEASGSLSSSSSYASYLMYRTWAYRPVSLKTLDESDLFDDDNNVSSTMNPIISNRNEYNKKRTTNLLVNSKLEWEIIDGLKLNVRGGYTRKMIETNQFNNSYTYKGAPLVNNSLGVNASHSESNRREWMNENTLTYNRQFGKRHKLNAMVGFTISGENREAYGFTTAQIVNESIGVSGMDEGIPQSTSAKLQSSTLMSFLARVNYSYRSKYLFTFSMREDGSSKFAPGNRWGFFPSGAFAWRMSQEKFMRRIEWIDDAKLRLSYGVTGNNRVDSYASYATLNYSDYYAHNNTPLEAIVQSTLGNRDLTWENTTQYNVGYDLRLFENRISFTVDLYRKITDNLLLNAKLPTTTGFASVYKNIGKIRNDGLELTLSTVNVRSRNFLWTTDFNISFNKDKVLELAEGQETLLSTVSYTGDFNSTYLYIAQQGGPVASFYGLVWDGVYGFDDFNVTSDGKYVLKNSVPTNGDARNTIQPGDIKYVDQNNDGVCNDADMVVIGRCAPIHTGGFNNTFAYMGLSLNIFFQWCYGNDIMNANRIMLEGNYANRNINQFKSYVDHWTPENQSSKNFRPGGQGPRGIYSSRTIEDGSFLRLKTLSLSYTIPARFTRKAKIENLTLSLSGQNLWTWTKYSGLDPEVSTKHSTLTPGFDYSAYARNRVYSLGLNLTF